MDRHDDDDVPMIYDDRQDDAHAAFAVPLLHQFADNPTNFWALSTALDALRGHWLKGRISPEVAAELEHVINRAEVAADLYAPDLSALDAFDGLRLLVDAWASPEGVPDSLSAPVLRTRRDPGVAIAKRLARILQNEAHNLCLRQEIAALAERAADTRATARIAGPTAVAPAAAEKPRVGAPLN